MIAEAENIGRPTVLVDGLVFENNYQIGIWRVFYEVMARSCGEIDYHLLLGDAAVQPIPQGVKVLKSAHRSECRRRNVLSRYLRRKSIRFLDRNYSHAIWHSTFFTIDPRNNKRSVVTVYDMIAEKFFLEVPGLEVQIEQKRKALTGCERVLCISEATARDFLAFEPLFTGKVVVSRLGCEHLSGPPERLCQRRTGVKHCVFVGARGGYKNFKLLVEAASLKEWPVNLVVRVVGDPFSAFELRLLEYYGVTHSFEHCGRLSDHQLAAEICSAVCLVFPSLGEGFGLPALEALANGCIPVLSDIPVFREIAEDVAIFFDPTCKKSLTQAVCSALERLGGEDFERRAKQVVTRFSWDHTARNVMEVYRNVWRRDLVDNLTPDRRPYF